MFVCPDFLGALRFFSVFWQFVLGFLFGFELDFGLDFGRLKFRVFENKREGYLEGILKDS